MAALQCYRESLSLHRAIGDRSGEALTRHQLGQVQRSLGDYTQATTLFKQALATHQSTGDRLAEVHTMYHLGFLYCRLAQFETAISILEQALTILREEFDDPWALGQALTYYSWTLINTGQFRAAKKYLQETMKVESRFQQKVTLIESAVHLGRVALALNDLSLANACARNALDFIEKRGTQGIEHPAMVYLTCYHILQADRQFEQAELILKQGQQYVAAQAAQIDDPALRQSYLANIPENQELQALADRIGE
jgi:tetratricopeptide (TPR) repeat protein